MKNILVAYDGEAPAKRALDLAIELTKRFDGEPVGRERRPHTHRVARRSIPGTTAPSTPRQLLEARRHPCRQNGVEAEMIEPAGDPAK